MRMTTSVWANYKLYQAGKCTLYLAVRLSVIITMCTSGVRNILLTLQEQRLNSAVTIFLQYIIQLLFYFLQLIFHFHYKFLHSRIVSLRADRVNLTTYLLGYKT